MRKILIAYATNAGSTVEVAQAVCKGLDRNGAQVEIKPMEAVAKLKSYDAVVVGAPMVFGWHREARAFLKQHQEELCCLPVAYFMVALTLTTYDEESYAGVQIYQDANLAEPPRSPTRLSFKERMTSVPNYVQPALESAPDVRPVSIGLFGGKLDYDSLNLFQRVFVRVAFGAAEGDFRNWDTIHTWSEDLYTRLVGGL
jgi:menaquinone-dependent protoporphyrinogen oxidase